METLNLDGHLQELSHGLHIVDPGLGGCLYQDEVSLLVENDVLLLLEVQNGLL